jgi:hypothetical protein
LEKSKEGSKGAEERLVESNDFRSSIIGSVRTDPKADVPDNDSELFSEALAIRWNVEVVLWSAPSEARREVDWPWSSPVRTVAFFGDC